MTTLTNGNRKVVVSKTGETINVWVGYSDPAGDVPALWFKGHRTCSATFKTYVGAAKAARKFLNS